MSKASAIYAVIGWTATGDGVLETKHRTKREAMTALWATLEAHEVVAATVYRDGEAIVERKVRVAKGRPGPARCSLVRTVNKPLMGRPFGRRARWLLHMACGLIHDTNLLEPPVSIPCRRSATCKHAAPPRVRPPFEW